jgi:hypothetical protein
MIIAAVCFATGISQAKQAERQIVCEKFVAGSVEVPPYNAAPCNLA